MDLECTHIYDEEDSALPLRPPFFGHFTVQRKEKGRMKRVENDLDPIGQVLFG
jgi:hypothetical protein